MGSGLAYRGICTNESGSLTSITVPLLSLFGDDFFNDQYEMFVLSAGGAAPEGERRAVTDYTSATGVFVVSAFSANVESGDEVLILHEALVTVGTRADAPASGAVTTIDTQMAYTKQVITDLLNVNSITTDNLNGKIGTDTEMADISIYDMVTELQGSIGNEAVTAVLRVSPNGDGTDGLTWATAYTTIQDALDAASVDDEDCTLILVGPHGAGYYDIDTTGDPTWAANVILRGSHRTWAKVKNDHESATSILKLTGRASVKNLNFNLGTGNNGLIMTRGAPRVYSCQFVGEDLTSAGTGLWLDHVTGGEHGKVIDCHFLGDGGTYMTALLIDQFGRSNFEQLGICECLTGIQIVGANSDANIFNFIDLGNNTLGMDLDAGNKQHFYGVIFRHNTTNVDDEVGDHIWINIYGAFLITTEPDNFTGVTVATGDGANVWTGAPVQVRAATDRPFRIIAIHTEADATEKFRVKLTDGTTVFMDFMVEGTTNVNKRNVVTAPSGTEFIFNKGIVISAYAKSESGGIDNALIWLEIQEI